MNSPALPLLGAHMSMAGGYYKAVDAAAEVGMNTCQLFTKNNNQWAGKPLTQEDADKFQAALKQHHIQAPIAHNSYLINLGSPDETLWKRSIDAMIDELHRAARLGIPYVVAHPGAFTTTDEATGLKRIAQGIDEVHRQTPNSKSEILLETTAGQGSCLGWRFEHLSEILQLVAAPERLGVCFDTCHVFAAGYPLGTPDEYAQTMQAFDRLIGLKLLRAFHLNDSVKGLGSRVDRHAHIGEGMLGLEPFRNLLNDPRVAGIPMYMETPKGDRDGEPLDAINLRTLHSLIGTTAPASQPGDFQLASTPSKPVRKTKKAKR